VSQGVKQQTMITSQLERLKQDYKELDYYIQRLQKEGNIDRIGGIQKKQKMLKDTIETLELNPEMMAG
jgi:hypothetical protein